MAESSVPITAGVGTNVKVDAISGSNVQVIKPGFGAYDSLTLVSPAAGLPVAAGQQDSPVYISPGLKTTESFTRAAIAAAGAGDNTLLAADAAKVFRVYAMLFTASGAVAVKFGETGPTYFTGAMQYGFSGGLWLPPMGEPYWKGSAVNKAFLVNLSAAVAINGIFWYTLV